VRAFLSARGYQEVETPCLVPAPGMEVHLRAFRTRYRPHLGAGREAVLWLRTSPELALKRLLVAGAGPVFELARVWRNGEAARATRPSSPCWNGTAPGLSLDGLMDETEALVRAACPPRVAMRGWRPTCSLPFERLTHGRGLRRHCRGLDILATVDAAGEGDAEALRAAASRAGLACRRGGWEDCFFRLLLERVEPRIGRDRATFLTAWPAPQAALARRDPADPRAALRFELFAAGIELANAFDELTDAAEQRARFTRDVEERRRIAGEEGWEVDEDFLAALEHGMPAGSGIALGFDRLAMLASGAPRIEDVLWLPPIYAERG
jgi:lysyl-tRNA synthetase class 2